MTSADLTPGTVIAGKFRLEQALSRGGMGSVWVARHVNLGHPVAIKFMDASYAESLTFRTRFEREARTAANLQHPHAVQVQDYGIENSMPFLVMELLQGEDLQRRLKRFGRMPLREAARILMQASKAIRKAHEMGLVHRDLKPANLYLVKIDDNEELVKVLDFGIAKEKDGQLEGSVTQTGEVLGSPYYMSPEQVRGDRELDARSDLWSLGVILYRLVTGEHPFSGDQLGTVMAKILVDPIPAARQFAPELPFAMDAFFAKALARDREQRFTSVREMMDALSEIAGFDGPMTGPVPKVVDGVLVSIAARATPSEAAELSTTASEMATLAMPTTESVGSTPAQVRGSTPAGHLGSARFSPPLDSGSAMTGSVGTLTTATGASEMRSVNRKVSKMGWVVFGSVFSILTMAGIWLTFTRLGDDKRDPASATMPEATVNPDPAQASSMDPPPEPVASAQPEPPALEVTATATVSASATASASAAATTVKPSAQTKPWPKSTTKKTNKWGL